MKIKGITATVVFESSAVNRDEKLSGNITSIKKLSRSNGTFSFMSRAFVRHHLFETLQLLHSWEAAPVIIPKSQNKQKKVIQFKFPAANIITYSEMDVFGFMNTSVMGSDLGIVRKAPLGITKAISLEPWQADMSFYANHDMVKRAIATGYEATPNPFQKEEHYSYYRVSFTIDLHRLGYHDILLKSVPAPLHDWIESFSTIGLEDLKDVDFDHVDEEMEKAKWYRIDNKDGSVRGVVGYLDVKDKIRIVFLVSNEERKKRIGELLSVIKNGIVMHSSTEDYGLVPVFSVIATLKVPVPVFNSYVNLANGVINTSNVNAAAENSYIERAWHSGILSLEGELDGKFEKFSSVEKILRTLD